jgi:hypothetical protein
MAGSDAYKDSDLIVRHIFRLEMTSKGYLRGRCDAT